MEPVNKFMHSSETLMAILACNSSYHIFTKLLNLWPIRMQVHPYLAYLCLHRWQNCTTVMAEGVTFFLMILGFLMHHTEEPNAWTIFEWLLAPVSSFYSFRICLFVLHDMIVVAWYMRVGNESHDIMTHSTLYMFNVGGGLCFVIKLNLWDSAKCFIATCWLYWIFINLDIW